MLVGMWQNLKMEVSNQYFSTEESCSAAKVSVLNNMGKSLPFSTALGLHNL